MAKKNEPIIPRIVSSEKGDYALFRERYVLFNKKDLEQYSKLLVEAFPTIRFYRGPKFGITYKDKNKKPNPVEIKKSLADFDDMFWGVEIFFNPDWKGDWYWDERFNEWSLMPTYLPNGVYSKDRIYFRYKRDNKETKRVADKVVRLIGKVATNKHQPGFEILDNYNARIELPEKGGYIWVGNSFFEEAKKNPGEQVIFKGFGKATYSPPKK